MVYMISEIQPLARSCHAKESPINIIDIGRQLDIAAPFPFANKLFQHALFTPSLTKWMEDEGTFMDRESAGSGSLDSLSTLRHKHSLNSQTLLRQIKSKLVPSRNEDPSVKVQIPFDKGLFHSTLAVSGTRVQHSGENIVIWQGLLHTNVSFKQRGQMTSSVHFRWKCYLWITRKMAHFVGKIWYCS